MFKTAGYGSTAQRAEQQRKQRIADHEADQAEEQRRLDQQQTSNAETRRRYLASLETAKAEKQKIADAEIDQELEPRKVMLMRQWLVDHPSETEAGFEKKAWPLLRQNLVAEREQTILEQTKNALRGAVQL